MFLSILNDAKKKLQPHFGMIREKNDGDSNTSSNTRSMYQIKIKKNRPS